jgi:hypothetical protein
MPTAITQRLRLVSAAIRLETAAKNRANAGAVIQRILWYLRTILTARTGRSRARSLVTTMAVPAVSAAAFRTARPGSLSRHACCKRAAVEADQTGPLPMIVSEMATAAAQFLVLLVSRPWIPTGRAVSAPAQGLCVRLATLSGHPSAPGLGGSCGPLTAPCRTLPHCIPPCANRRSNAGNTISAVSPDIYRIVQCGNPEERDTEPIAKTI